MVSSSTLVGSDAACEVCGWKGRKEDLVASDFSQEMGSAEEIFRQLTLDIRQLLSKSVATEFVRLLAKWGFIGNQINRQEVARYLGGVAKGITQGIIQVRGEIEKERGQG